MQTSVPRAVHVLSANCHGQSPVAAIWMCVVDLNRCSYARCLLSCRLRKAFVCVANLGLFDLMALSFSLYHALADRSCDSDTSRVAREHASTLGEPFFALPLESKRLRGALLHRFGVFRETLPRVVILDGWTGKVCLWWLRDVHEVYSSH